MYKNEVNLSSLLNNISLYKNTIILLLFFNEWILEFFPVFLLSKTRILFTVLHKSLSSHELRFVIWKEYQAYKFVICTSILKYFWHYFHCLSMVLK